MVVFGGFVDLFLMVDKEVKNVGVVGFVILGNVEVILMVYYGDILESL